MTAAFTPLSYSHLAVRSADDLIFGVAPKPVRCGLGLEIGAGKVYPEVNFTLPTMDMTDETWPEVCAHYEEIGRNVVARAVHLKAPGLVLEFELLPPMTERPEWGAELTGILKKHMKAANEKWGLPCALRVTPTDIREKGKPPLMRRGEPWEQLRRSFELNAAAGADILSIELIGGKEVHDKALMNGDLPGIVLGLGVLAPRDMAWLWAQIRAICDGHPGVVPGGDFGVRVRQHRDAVGWPENAARGARRRRAGDEHGARPRRVRARRHRPVEGLRLRRAGDEGDRGCAHRDGRQVGRLRPL